MTELTGDDLVVLQLAGRGLAAGPLANAIRDAGFTSDIAYYRKLHWLLEQEAALKAYPVLVNRLRRLRDSRSAARRR